MYCNLFLLYLSNHRWKNIIYQLRKWLKIWEINQKLKLWARGNFGKFNFFSEDGREI